VSAALATAARELLDAFAGDYPDHLNAELVRLAQALAVIEAEELGDRAAMIEHLRAAEHCARRLGLPRVLSAIREASDRAAAALGRVVMHHQDEARREAHRLAGLPDPMPTTPEETEK
jgi:hypothetical protein